MTVYAPNVAMAIESLEHVFNCRHKDRDGHTCARCLKDEVLIERAISALTGWWELSMGDDPQTIVIDRREARFKRDEEWVYGKIVFWNGPAQSYVIDHGPGPTTVVKWQEIQVRRDSTCKAKLAAL